MYLLYLNFFFFKLMNHEGYLLVKPFNFQFFNTIKYYFKIFNCNFSLLKWVKVCYKKEKKEMTRRSTWRWSIKSNKDESIDIRYTEQRIDKVLQTSSIYLSIIMIPSWILLVINNMILFKLSNNLLCEQIFKLLIDIFIWNTKLQCFISWLNNCHN